METPLYWERLLQQYVKRTFYPGTRKETFAREVEFTEGDYRFFATGIRRLNEFFTKERPSLPKNYFNQKDLRSGYILYFLPVNALKVASLLSQSDLSLRPEITILDVGSGPGTGLLGTLLYLERLFAPRKGAVRIQLRWILVDQNRAVLDDASRLHEDVLASWREIHPEWEVDSKVQTVPVDLMRGGLPKALQDVGADLILCLNLLSELPEGKRIFLLERLLKKSLRPGGRVLVMEPALQKTTRDLMQVRDDLLARGSATVLAPCLHQEACPMLAANRRDWCHTYLEWGRPAWIEKMDRLAGIRKDYLKCSYLILGKEEISKCSNDLWRVVSGHLNSRGKSELLLCGPGGLPNLLRVMRLDRDRSAANRVFDEVQRGDLVQMSKVSRITQETILRRD